MCASAEKSNWDKWKFTLISRLENWRFFDKLFAETFPFCIRNSFPFWQGSAAFRCLVEWREKEIFYLSFLAEKLTREKRNHKTTTTKKSLVFLLIFWTKKKLKKLSAVKFPLEKASSFGCDKKIIHERFGTIQKEFNLAFRDNPYKHLKRSSSSPWKYLREKSTSMCEFHEILCNQRLIR